MREERTRKGSAFWKFLLVFALFWILLWGLLIGYVWTCLRSYEAAQPERRVEEAVAALRAGELEKVFGTGTASSRFEDPALLRQRYEELVVGKDLTYRKAPGSYDAGAPVYDLYAGETRVATLSLRGKSSRPLMFILTLQDWEMAGAEPGPDRESLTYTVSIPNSYSLLVNGIPADGRERTGERRELEQFRYAAAYVTVPAMVEYRIDGLTAEPDIRVYSADGQEAELTRTGEGQLEVEHFVPSEMPPELAEFVLRNAKDYSNFFSRDLPGARASTAGLRGMFPKDSYYLELAENYRRHDMWMYSSHYEPTFSDERVENYVPYSEDFFSCEVSFDKKMVLTSTGQERHDFIHTRFYYVRIKDSWVIADMQQILSQEE